VRVSFWTATLRGAQQGVELVSALADLLRHPRAELCPEREPGHDDAHEKNGVLERRQAVPIR
jgi:hypothetical protein